MPPPFPPDLQGLSSGVHLFLCLRDTFVRSLVSLVTLFFSFSALPGLILPGVKYLQPPDPCAAIAGQEWVAPSDVRACFTSFQVDPVEKENVGDNYDLPHLLLFVLTSYPIIRSLPLPQGSSTSTRPPTTKSRHLNHSLPTSMKISSATSSESTGHSTTMTLTSTSTFRVLSRG